MDISHYFKPVDFSEESFNLKELDRQSIGKTIDKPSGTLMLNDISRYKILIIGAPFHNGNKQNEPTTDPDRIRRQLYRLPFTEKIKIADVGNLIGGKSFKETMLSLRDVTSYISEAGAIPIILGGSQDLTSGICQAFSDQPLFSLAVVDALLDVKKENEAFSSTNYLTRIFKYQENLFQFSLLGYQGHLIAPRLFARINAMTHHVRLGRLREKFEEAEPVLRNSDVLSFDLGAIKYSESPASYQANPNGLQNDEACRIAKYAGLSCKMKAFGLFEYCAEKDVYSITSKLAAEMIWYFMEGVARREPVDNWQVPRFMMYKVQLKDLDEPLVFYKDNNNGRWWFEINAVSGERVKFACSESDYQQAIRNEIPDRWLKFIQKIDEKSK